MGFGQQKALDQEFLVEKGVKVLGGNFVLVIILYWPLFGEFCSNYHFFKMFLKFPFVTGVPKKSLLAFRANCRTRI